MKRILILFIIMFLIFTLTKPTFANTYITGPLTKQVVAETQPLKFFLEFSYENYNLRKGSGYTGGILYHITDQIGIEASFSFNEVVQRIKQTEGLEPDSVISHNMGLFLGDLNNWLLFMQSSLEEGTKEEGTNKIGVAHSFQLSDTNKLILGGGTLNVKKVDKSDEDSPFLVIEFQNQKTYCRLQYTSGLTTEFLNSEAYLDGTKKISWILSFGYTF